MHSQFVTRGASQDGKKAPLVAARTQPQHPGMLGDLSPDITLPGQSSTERFSPAWCNYSAPESRGSVAQTGLEAALSIYPEIFASSFTPVRQWSSRKIIPPWKNLNIFSSNKTSGGGLIKKKNHQKHNTAKQNRDTIIQMEKVFPLLFILTNSRRQIPARECGPYL